MCTRRARLSDAIPPALRHAQEDRATRGLVEVSTSVQHFPMLAEGSHDLWSSSEEEDYGEDSDAVLSDGEDFAADDDDEEEEVVDDDESL